MRPARNASRPAAAAAFMMGAAYVVTGTVNQACAESGTTDLVRRLLDAGDFPKAIAKLKEAQEKWKAIGPVPRDQADAVWELLSRQGESVGVIGWLVPYPAEPLNGFLGFDLDDDHRERIVP